MVGASKQVGVGVDFGTSNSAVAWYDGEKLRLARLEHSGAIMPTATHLDREFIVLTGEAAVEQYIEENRDRIVELTPEVIGKSMLLVNEGDPTNSQAAGEAATHTVYGKAVNDRGMPGRLFRGVKRLLGSTGLNRLLVFDRPFRLVALITPIILRMRQTIEAELGEEIKRAHVGYPVNFEGSDPYRNKLAISRLQEAYGYAGFEQIEFYPEPLAATLSFFHDEPHRARGVVLAFDFGGGTLDLSLVRYHGMEFDVLATGGLPLGGDHIDQLIFRQLLFPLLGKGEIWSRKVDGQLIENFFPFEELEEALLNWAVTYTLNQNRYRSKISDCIAAGGPGAAKFERLDDLIKHNYSYVVFQAIKDAKAALSSQEDCLLDIAELDICVDFSRSQLDEIMTRMLGDIRELIDEVLVSAGLTADKVDLVIRTGGSSQIVAVRNLLEEYFPSRVTEHYPFTSVAAGLALASYHGHHFTNPDIE